MTFWPGPPPANAGPLGAYIRAELEKIAAEMRELPTLQLKVLHVEPAKPRDGMVIATDGTDLDLDASGDPGVFARLGGAWVRLG